MHLAQQLLFKALKRTGFNVKQAIGLNFKEGSITPGHYYKLLEKHRICIKLRKII